MRKSLLISIIVVAGCSHYSDDKPSARDQATKTASGPGIVYSNPRVYNVDYSFEMVPDPNNIDRAKDLKVWLPIPREWDSQKAVKIISVQPEPHARYVDPEYGNPMFFWDFGKEPEQPCYKVDIKFRLESYDVSVKVDPNRIGSYDKTSKEYALYTQSTHTMSITPKVRELAQVAIGDEKNPYLQAKRILEFVGKKVRYKMTFERGVQYLLDNPIKDDQGKEEYYVGACGQFSSLFVTLCRAVGIPARSVGGFIGWRPWAKAEDLKQFHPYETKLSPAGLAGARFCVALKPHTWAEFYISGFGWVPVDAMGGVFGYRGNRKLIMTKASDVKIGPHAPEAEGGGYGFQWVPIKDGRVDGLQAAVWNIAKIRTSKLTILHHSDPFPADGLAGYLENLLPSEEAEKDHGHWRQGVLSRPCCYIRNLIPENLNLDQFYKDYPRAKEDREAFVCHMLHSQLGDEKFSRLVKTYVDLRQKSGQAIPTSLFQELTEGISGQSLGWFFNQWVNNTDLPRFKLENVSVGKDENGWQIRGRLVQSGNTIFRLPVELALNTKNGGEKRKLWVETKATDFEFSTFHEPRKLVVDPDYKTLKVQEMPPSLWWFWDIYPKIKVIYGTLGETEANKAAAERFNSEDLGLGPEIVKADTDVNDADLKTECVFLIGRPETNKIAQEFKDIFPIKFDKNKFTWQGVTYAQPAQAVAQIAENPGGAHNLIIMYAGLSPEATQEFPSSYVGCADRSYVIFDGDKALVTGDWQDVDNNLYWNFDKEAKPL